MPNQIPEEGIDREKLSKALSALGDNIPNITKALTSMSGSIQQVATSANAHLKKYCESLTIQGELCKKFGVKASSLEKLAGELSSITNTIWSAANRTIWVSTEMRNRPSSDLFYQFMIYLDAVKKTYLRESIDAIRSVSHCINSDCRNDKTNIFRVFPIFFETPTCNVKNEVLPVYLKTYYSQIAHAVDLAERMKPLLKEMIEELENDEFFPPEKYQRPIQNMISTGKQCDFMIRRFGYIVVCLDRWRVECDRKALDEGIIQILSRRQENQEYQED